MAWKISFKYANSEHQHRLPNKWESQKMHQRYARLCNFSNVNAITEEHDPDQPIQDTYKANCVDYLQVWDVIPEWELIHPDDRSVNVVNYSLKS